MDTGESVWIGKELLPVNRALEREEEASGPGSLKRSFVGVQTVVVSSRHMGGTFQATAGFQDSDIFQKAVKLVFRCIVSVLSHLSGFKL